MALPDLAAIFRRESADPSVMVADGYKITVVVRNGQLRISDGVASQRRERTISRAPRTVSRIIILGTTGYVTLESYRWCADEGIAISQIDQEGRVIASAPGQAGNHKILRSQMLVSFQGADSSVALAIVKRLVTAKLSGQSDIARTKLGWTDAAGKIDAQSHYITSAATIDAVQGYEGVAASAYWSAWSQVKVPFSPADLLKVPSHWHSFTGRKSEPGATDPVNAMLNYAYRMAESEARHACHINGLDPSVGFMHATRDGRDSLALDLMECIRPACDRIVLSLLDYGQGIPYSRGRPVYFPANWVYEIRHGVTRLFAPLTHMLAEHTLELAEVMFPVVADIVSLLGSAVIGDAPGKLPAGNGSHVRRYAPPRKPGRPLAATGMPVPGSATDVIPDDAWRIISSKLPVKPPNRTGGARRMDDRVIIAGLVWCSANNLPTTRVPDSLGVSGHTLYQRRKRWIESGHWDRIVHAIRRTVLPGYTGG